MPVEPSDDINALTHRTIGAAIEVHRRLGPGFSEAIYERAMLIELAHIGLPARSQVPVPVLYRDQPISDGVIDLLIDGQLVVELKAVAALGELHRAQLLSYLKACELQLGLLINFNVPVLTAGLRRVVRTPTGER